MLGYLSKHMNNRRGLLRFCREDASKSEAEENKRTHHDANPPHLAQVRWDVNTTVESTSSTENRVDALALKADEGRGDRRNVPGELHASDEPGESEWGNPSRVMSGDRLLNT